MRAEGHTWEMTLPPTKLGRKAARGVPYEHRLLCDIHSESFAGTAFDVGAYYGNHSLYLAVVCGLSVHAFEPDTGRLEWLRANIEANQADVTVHPWAAGRRTGSASRVKGHKAAKLSPTGGPISVYRVDDQLHVDDLAVVKLDIEGMEAAALEGMTDHLERCRPVIYSETHDDGADQRAVLEPLGYQLEERLRVPSPMWKWRPR